MVKQQKAPHVLPVVKHPVREPPHHCLDIGRLHHVSPVAVIPNERDIVGVLLQGHVFVRPANGPALQKDLNRLLHQRVIAAVLGPGSDLLDLLLEASQRGVAVRAHQVDVCPVLDQHFHQCPVPERGRVVDRSQAARGANIHLRPHFEHLRNGRLASELLLDEFGLDSAQGRQRRPALLAALLQLAAPLHQLDYARAVVLVVLRIPCVLLLLALLDVLRNA
mmetsp:Transcript_4466/g.8363  ORF Transcript_4466/g.8363 Transcript_4466/m.8363 type:complete len:221 (+) Transcript_4466:1267-1929(+)